MRRMSAAEIEVPHKHPRNRLVYRTKKPPRLNTISNMLQNPFYYGVFAHKGEQHQSAHIPMISCKFGFATLVWS